MLQLRSKSAAGKGYVFSNQTWAWVSFDAGGKFGNIDDGGQNLFWPFFSFSLHLGDFLQFL